MNNVFLTIALSFLFTSSAIGSSGKISRVIIIDSKSSIPIPYANVCWLHQNHKNGKGNAVSGPDGVVAIDPGISGSLDFHISFVGYKPFSGTLEFPGNHIITLEEDIFNLEQITVTGTRTPHTLKNAPVLTQLVTAGEINRQGLSTIKDVLEMELPSVEMGRHGFGTSMSMQGLASKYTLVLIDGERMAGESGGNIDFSRINVANIEQVEIIRGASSALYGSNAMGGVINIITKTPRKKWDVTARTQYTQLNERNNTKLFIKEQDEHYLRELYRRQDLHNLNADISLGYRTKNFYTNTFAAYKSFDAYQLYNTSGRKRVYLHNDSVVNDPVITSPTQIKGFSDFALSNKTAISFGKQWKSVLRSNYYDHEEAGFQKNGRHNRYKNYTLGGQVDYAPDSAWNLRLSHHFDKYDKYHVMEKLNNENRLNYRNVFHNSKITGNLVLKKHALQFGAENFHESLNGDMFIYGELITKTSNDAVIVIQDEYRLLESLMIVAGLRSGYHSTFKAHASPSITVRLGAEHLNYRLSYARGYRSPSLKELYMNWDHQGMFTIIGSESLKPETNNYYALSADYLNEGKSINATIISSYNQIYGKIDGVWQNNQTEYHYVNFEDQRVFSNEVLLRWKILKPLGIKGGYAYTRVLMDKNVVNRSVVSPHVITLQMDYRYQLKKYTLGARLSGKITGAKKVNVLDSGIGQYYREVYPVFSLWNLTLNHTIANRWNLDTGVKNLFNYKAPIVTFNTTASPGRQLFVACAYNF